MLNCTWNEAQFHRHHWPAMEDFIRKFHDCTIWTKSDLRKGYHQLALYPESRSVAKFSTPWGNSRPKMLVFEAKASSDLLFDEILNRILRYVPGNFIQRDDPLNEANYGFSSRTKILGSFPLPESDWETSYETLKTLSQKDEDSAPWHAQKRNGERCFLCETDSSPVYLGSRDLPLSQDTNNFSPTTKLPSWTVVHGHASIDMQAWTCKMWNMSLGNMEPSYESHCFTIVSYSQFIFWIGVAQAVVRCFCLDLPNAAEIETDLIVTERLLIGRSTIRMFTWHHSVHSKMSLKVLME